jgi:excisionase family DNA binding protein
MNKRRRNRAKEEGRLTLTIPEAALLLGISRNAGYDAANRGELPTIRIGRLLLVPRARLDRLLAGEASQADAGGVA